MSLASFIQEHREQIVQAWMAEAASLPAARGQSWGMLRDHVPQMLDEIARVLDGNTIPPGALENLAARHATMRYRKGYDPRQVVAEYQALRRAILTMYDAELGEMPRDLLRPVSAFNDMLDVAIADAIDRFVDERDRAREIFVAILGHDLRTPLQTMAMGAQMLLARGEQIPLTRPGRLTAGSVSVNTCSGVRARRSQSVPRPRPRRRTGGLDA